MGLVWHDETPESAWGVGATGAMGSPRVPDSDPPSSGLLAKVSLDKSLYPTH